MPRLTLAFAALLIGCAVSAQAQVYPPDPYRAPPIAAPDDDDPYFDPPGDYRRPMAPRSRSDQRRYEAGPYPYERDPYFRPPYADAAPYGVVRPPAAIYPDDRPAPPTYASPPGYGRPDYPGAPPQSYPRPAEIQPGYGTPPRGQPLPSARGPGDSRYAALPPDYQAEEGDPKELAPQLRRQIVEYRTREPAGTILIDTAHTYLYYVLGNGQALRYGIGVGREGFTWTGEERISRMAEWPDWHPPADMIERQPYLPRFMAGGPGNPLGARALYLGKTLYRIHGTNQPSTIGQFVSSGCIRLLNEDVEDLYGRVQVGTRVVVLPGRAPSAAATPR